MPLVKILPKRTLDAGRLPLMKPWNQTFQVQGTSPDLKLGKPEIESNYRTGAILERAEKAGMYRLEVRLEPVQQSGDWKCKVKIPVTTPTNHAPVEIMVTARLGLKLIAVPSIAYLQVSEKPVARRFRLRVLGRGGPEPRPESLKLPQVAGISFSVLPGPKSTGLILATTFSPDFTKQLAADENTSFTVSLPGVASAIITCKTRK